MPCIIINHYDCLFFKKTLFIWPEGVFSGYSFEEVQVFKELIASNFSKKQIIIFGINRLDKASGNFPIC